MESNRSTNKEEVKNPKTPSLQSLIDKVLGPIEKTLSKSKLSEASSLLLGGMIGGLNAIASSKFTDEERVKAIMMILKQIEGIRLQPPFSVSSIFSKGSTEVQPSSPKLSTKMGLNSRTNFATFNTSFRFKNYIPSDEAKIFSEFHDNLLNVLKTKYGVAWAFDYKPNENSLANWHKELDARLNLPMNKVRGWPDVDFQRDVYFLEDGVKSRMPEMPKSSKADLENKTTEELNKIGEKKLSDRVDYLKDYLASKVEKATAYTSPQKSEKDEIKEREKDEIQKVDKKGIDEKALVVDWMARNAGQDLNDFFKINLISSGCFYDAGPDSFTPPMGTQSNTYWQVNGAGQMEMQLSLTVSALSLNPNQILAYDPEIKQFRTINNTEDLFEKIGNDSKSGIASPNPVMKLQAKIALEVQDGKVVPVIKENYILSYTDKLQSPARFEVDKKYANDAKFSPNVTPTSSPELSTKMNRRDSKS